MGHPEFLLSMVCNHSFVAGSAADVSIKIDQLFRMQSVLLLFFDHEIAESFFCAVLCAIIFALTKARRCKR